LPARFEPTGPGEARGGPDDIPATAAADPMPLRPDPPTAPLSSDSRPADVEPIARAAPALSRDGRSASTASDSTQLAPCDLESEPTVLTEPEAWRSIGPPPVAEVREYRAVREHRRD